MRIDFKKLPSHWAYPISRRDIKQVVVDLEADVRVILFNGPTSRSRKSSLSLSQSFYVAHLDARVDKKQWCYRLWLHGLDVKRFSDHRKNIRESMLSDIRKFISACEARAAVETTKPLERHYFFKLKDGVVEESFSTKKQGHMSRLIDERKPWWE